MDDSVFSAARVFATDGRNPAVESQDRAGPTPWPPFPPRARQYRVKREESVLEIPYLYIPADCTIVLANDVDRIEWRIGLLEFGRNATMDVSVPRGIVFPPPDPGQPPPNAPPAPPQVPGRPALFAKGHTGYPGTPGLAGRAGRALAWFVTDVIAKGSLWIRTDGQYGGTGGRGGQGQDGGDSECRSEDDTYAGPGGDGGRGGDGGPGGATSDVLIRIESLPVGYVLEPVACMSGCGTSMRPSTASGDDGRIVPWGGRGCGGVRGSRGSGGSGGRGTDGCGQWGFPPVNWNVRPGAPGNIGLFGAPGGAGACGRARIVGP